MFLLWNVASLAVNLKLIVEIATLTRSERNQTKPIRMQEFCQNSLWLLLLP